MAFFLAETTVGIICRKMLCLECHCDPLTVKREYHKWWSPHLGRDMELLVFGHQGPKMLVFPTRLHRFYEYENMGMVELLRPKIEQGHLQIFCVDSLDLESLYARNLPPPQRIERHLRYEEYIVREVIPLIRHGEPTAQIVAHGCSLGAFHALNFAFRNPHLFHGVVAFSGRYDLTVTIENFEDLFDGFRNQDVLLNTPTRYLADLTCDRILLHLRRMRIHLLVGYEDPFRPNNELMAEILTAKSIPHLLSYWEGRAHSPEPWRAMAAQHL